MGNKDKAPNKNFQGGGHSFERTRCPTSGRNILIGVLQERMVVFHVVIRSMG